MRAVQASLARDVSSKPTALNGQPTAGALRIDVERRAGRNVATNVYQQAPLRALFPVDGATEALTVVAANISGGVVDGDCLDMSVNVGNGASAHITTQAAEKVYRSIGQSSVISTELSGAECQIEYLPQGAIVFDQARLKRATSIDVCGKSRVLAGEMTMLGRSAMGETFITGALAENWRVRVDGKLIWADSFRLIDDSPGGIERAAASSAGLDGATAIGTIIYVAQGADERIEQARAALPGRSDAFHVGVTAVNGILLFRLLCRSQQALREEYGKLWASLRQMLGHGPAALPRIWQM